MHYIYMMDPAPPHHLSAVVTALQLAASRQADGGVLQFRVVEQVLFPLMLPEHLLSNSVQTYLLTTRVGLQPYPVWWQRLRFFRVKTVPMPKSLPVALQF